MVGNTIRSAKRLSLAYITIQWLHDPFMIHPFLTAPMICISYDIILECPTALQFQLKHTTIYHSW